MAFEEEMKWRSADFYADFFYPYLQSDDCVLDCGCGMGTITVGLARYVPDGSVIGIDIKGDEFEPAVDYLQKIRVARWCPTRLHVHNTSEDGACVPQSI